MPFKVMIDGKLVKARNDVKVIWEDDEDGVGGKAETHLTATDEGIVVDFIIGGEVDDTTSRTVDQLIDMLDYGR